MPRVEESIPSYLAEVAEAARAWFSSHEGSDFKLTGIVDPQPADAFDAAADPREIQLILCGHQDGQDVCLRERFAVTRAGEGFAVQHLDEPAPAVGSPAPLLDPPVGVRAGWLDEAMKRHAFVVLLFYRGFW